MIFWSILYAILFATIKRVPAQESHVKWVKRVLLSLLLFLLLAIIGVYAWSGVIIHKKYDAVERNIMPSSRPEVIEKGKRLAQLYGCYEGCHGVDMEGRVFFEGLAIGKIISPNLTTAVDKYTRSEMEAIIRQGIRPDGTSVMAMPSASFATMTDGDLSAILAFIESYPKQDQDLGYSSIGIMPRAMLVIGEFKPAAAEADGEPAQSSDLRTPAALGEYLTVNACSECHGMELEGMDGFSPPLTIAKGYSLEDFSKLMSTGLGLGDRDLGLMSEVAESRFVKMNGKEVEAIHTFLTSR
jgi:cytochrome c553